MGTPTPHTEIINDLLKLAVDSGASDVIIKSNKPGYVRLSGKLKPVEMDPITSSEVRAFIDEHVPAVVRQRSSASAGRTWGRSISRMPSRTSDDFA